MTSSRVQIIFFGNQTDNLFEHSVGLLHGTKESKLLEDFLQRSCSALIDEILALDDVGRDQFPKFNTIIELAEAHHQSGSQDNVINDILLCLTQLGYFIRYTETKSHGFLSPDAIYVGLSIGLISAAAIASSKSLVNLLETAVNIVRVCFKAAVTARRRARQIELTSGSKKFWSVSVSGLSSESIKSSIEEFHQEHNMVPGKEAYVSAELESSVTVSGPPSTLDLLFSSSAALKTVERKHLCIQGVYHAAHLGSVNMETIVDDRWKAEHRFINGWLYSTRNGKRLMATNLRDLLMQVVEDLLIEPLRWNRVVSEVTAHLTLIGCAEVDIISFGQSEVSKNLAENFRKAGITACIKSTAVSVSTGSSNSRQGAVAIIGMSGRFPEGENLEEFWKTLRDGLDVHKKVPTDRFDIKTHFDSSGVIRNTTLTPYGCFLERPGFFDAPLFNMTPREALQTDPQQRLALMATYEALEMAGHVSNRTPSTNNRRIGTFFGQTTDDYREANASQNIDTYFITGGMRAFGPGRLNYYFNWEGPSYSIDTACSSSAAAIQLAYSALLNHDCDTVVAGGMNLLTACDSFAGLSRAGFLSKTGSCKTFDHDADGYCRADAVACLVMKRLEDAVADNDNVQAILLGCVTNHSAEAVSITHPHVETQKRLYRRLLNDAMLQPNDINYIEMHGTGTQAGDLAETQAVTQVFASDRHPEKPLYIGSVKSNIGHGEAASGITSIIKAILMLQKNVIPPHIGIKNRLNSKLPLLDALNTHIPKDLTEFKPYGENSKRRIVINNFNATGGNTSLVIEDPPICVTKGVDPRSVHIVVISAKSPFSFKANAERLLTYITENPASSVGDISYTTTARRIHHSFRTALLVSNIKELKSSLNEVININKMPSRSSPINVAFVFTGQGSHYLNMGKELLRNCFTFRKDMMEYNDICQRQGFPSFISLINNDSSSPETFSQIQIQLAIIAVELALANLCLYLGIRPSIVMGHSLGEYAALCVAGVLSITDTFFLVGKRASLLVNKSVPGTHTMLAVMCEPAMVRTDLRNIASSIEIACLNGPQATVVSGYASDIAYLMNFYKLRHINTKQLDVSYAFHSSQLDAILEDFRNIGKSVLFSKPVIPVASTLLASIVTEEGVFTPDYLCRHARESVKFFDTLNECKASGIIDERTLWVEIGPDPICLTMVKSTLKVSGNLTVPTLKKGESSLSAIAACVSKIYVTGTDVNWMAYHREYESTHRLLPLPTYAFDLKNYWIQYDGDWGLRKNLSSTPQRSQAVPANFIRTTSLQRIESERFAWRGADVVFSSNLRDSELQNAIRGHAILDVPLCSICIFADMAVTAAEYIHKCCEPFAEMPAIDVINMEALHPLVLNDSLEEQFVYIVATRKAGLDATKIEFISGEGSAKKTYASCSIQFENAAGRMTKWMRHAYLIRSRMNHLIKEFESGKLQKLSKSIAYELFSILIHYSERYRGIEEVWMDSNMLEATANIKFETKVEDGSFVMNPYWLDSIIHLAGLVLNSTCERFDDVVYTANGWKSFSVLGHLSTEKSYKSYVRMQPINERNLMSGDVYVFDGDDVVAVCAGFKFQRIRRSVLGYLLSSSLGTIPLQKPQTVPDGTVAFRSPQSTMSTDMYSSVVFDDILEIIASETGLEKAELHDETNFNDLGVDSLLTISILAKLYHVTKMNIPTSVFQIYSTVRDLRTFYNENQSLVVNTNASRSTQLVNNECSIAVERSKISSSISSSHLSPENANNICFIIASNTEFAEAENPISAVLTGKECDALIKSSKAENSRVKLDMNIPKTFSRSHSDLLSIGEQFEIISEVSAVNSSNPRCSLQHNSTFKKSKSILLQKSSNNLPPLFLLPDGSGSASSYVSLPVFKNSMTIYGLDSPFLDNPSEFICTIEEIAGIYLAEIQRIQPNGPYILGGWSAGGILAYEIATQLIAAGEKVLGLILIDSPCPLSIPPLSVEYLDLFESLGIFKHFRKSSKNTVAAIKENFIAWINAIRYYKPMPIDPSRVLKVLALWANEGILESISHENVTFPKSDSTDELESWILRKKKQCNSGGWEKLIPSIDSVVVPGNHFTIMRQPQVKTLAKQIEEAFMVITSANEI